MMIVRCNWFSHTRGRCRVARRPQVDRPASARFVKLACAVRVQRFIRKSSLWQVQFEICGSCDTTRHNTTTSLYKWHRVQWLCLHTHRRFRRIFLCVRVCVFARIYGHAMPATPHMQIVSVAIIAINVSGHLCARNINENAFSTHSHSPERYILVDTIYNQIIYYHSINTKLYANICWFQISLLVHISHGYGDGFFFL